jgi:hypothetical protein
MIRQDRSISQTGSCSYWKLGRPHQPHNVPDALRTADQILGIGESTLQLVLSIRIAKLIAAVEEAFQNGAKMG